MLGALLVHAVGQRMSVSRIRFFRNTNVVCLEFGLSREDVTETRLVSQNLVLAYWEMDSCRNTSSLTHTSMSRLSCESSERIICSRRSRGFTANLIKPHGIRGNVTVDVTWRTHTEDTEQGRETWEIDLPLHHLFPVRPEYSQSAVADLCSLYGDNCANCTLSCSDVFRDEGVTCHGGEGPPRGAGGFLKFLNASHSPLRIDITEMYAVGFPTEEVCMSFRLRSSGGVAGDWPDVWQLVDVILPDEVRIEVEGDVWVGHQIRSSDPCHSSRYRTFMSQDPASEARFCMVRRDAWMKISLPDLARVGADWRVAAQTLGKGVKYRFSFSQVYPEVRIIPASPEEPKGFGDNARKCADQRATDCRKTFSAFEGFLCRRPETGSEASKVELQSKTEETCEEAPAAVEAKRIRLYADAGLVCLEFQFDGEEGEWEILSHNLTLSYQFGYPVTPGSLSLHRAACTTDRGYLCVAAARPILEPWTATGFSGTVEFGNRATGERTMFRGRHIDQADNYSSVSVAGRLPKRPCPSFLGDCSSSCSMKCSDMFHERGRLTCNGIQISFGRSPEGANTDFPKGAPFVANISSFYMLPSQELLCTEVTLSSPLHGDGWRERWESVRLSVTSAVSISLSSADLGKATTTGFASLCMPQGSARFIANETQHEEIFCFALSNAPAYATAANLSLQWELLLRDASEEGLSKRAGVNQSYSHVPVYVMKQVLPDVCRSVSATCYDCRQDCRHILTQDGHYRCGAGQVRRLARRNSTQYTTWSAPMTRASTPIGPQDIPLQPGGARRFPQGVPRSDLGEEEGETTPHATTLFRAEDARLEREEGGVSSSPGAFPPEEGAVTGFSARESVQLPRPGSSGEGGGQSAASDVTFVRQEGVSRNDLSRGAAPFPGRVFSLGLLLLTAHLAACYQR